MCNSELKLIGQGAGGTVYEKSLSGKRLAVKMFDLQSLSGKSSFQAEAAVHKHLKKVRSNRFAKIYTIKQDVHEGTMIMKLYDQDLFEFMQHTTLTEKNFRSIFRSICKGVKKLHQARIAHLDLKPENILMKGNKPFITDFGSCFIEPIEDSSMLNTAAYTGTIFYSPPEVNINRRMNPYKADIFSLGVLLHVSLTGVFPFNQFTGEYDLCYARQMLSVQACRLLERMMSFSPLDRPSIFQVLADTWLCNKKL
jgi:serine/threonine protein kinase